MLLNLNYTKGKSSQVCFLIYLIKSFSKCINSALYVINKVEVKKNKRAN